MKSFLNHIQVNIDPASKNFYKDLFALLEWTCLYEDSAMLGLGTDTSSIWFFAAADRSMTDYDQRGVNHIGISVGEQTDVDRVVEFLREKNIPSLFDTPRHRKEFAASDRDTYYQVMFESPDKVLLEVMYKGPIAP